MNEEREIRLDRVSKCFPSSAGDVFAVDDLSLCLDSGTSLAIVGPSGCGKSTLLALIGGIERPSKGDVHYGKYRLSTMSQRHRARLRREEFGFVFQADNLLPFLTATENISQQIALSGARDFTRSLELLHAMDLAECADMFPDQLSGGQRQRVAVARALAHRPRTILADEPTGSLDPTNAMVLIDLLCAFQRNHRATLIVVTHDLNVAARMEQTIWLSDGHVEEFQIQ